MMSANHKHPTSATSGQPAPKRMRVSRACEQCRSRKAKCDGSQPTCSTCTSLGQTCSYGPPPKKRGLPPGSFSMLERTVKLFEKVLGLLFLNVPGSDDVLLSLVQTCGNSLVEDGPEGEALTKAWKEGDVLKALEALQAVNNNNNNSNSDATTKKPVRKSMSSASPGLETAQRLFKDASKSIPKPKPIPVPLPAPAADFADGNQDPSFGGQFGDVSWMSDLQQNANAAEYETGQNGQQNGDGGEEEFSTSPPITIDPLLMNPTANFVPPLDTTSAVAVQTQMSLASPLAPPSISGPPAQTLRSQPPLQDASRSTLQLQSSDYLSTRSKPEFPPNSKSLLDLYFAYTHSWFPILDKYDIIRLFHAYNDSSTAAAAAAPKDRSGDANTDGKRALLYAVLAVASLQRESLPTKSRQKVELVSDTSDLYIRSQSILFSPNQPVSLESVQALLLLSLVNLSQGQLSTAWLLIGLAGRIAIDLRLDEPSSEIRQKSRFALRAWLGFVVLEVFVSQKLKREPMLSGVEWQSAGVEVDGWEEWDSWKDVAVALNSREDADIMDDNGHPAHILSVFNQLIAISKHVYEVSRIKAGGKEQHHHHQKSRSRNVFVDLQGWVRGLPEHCALDLSRNASAPLLPHVLNLHSFYLNTVVEAHFSGAPQGSARSHHPSLSTSAHCTLSWFNQFNKTRSLAVSPCMFLHYLEGITTSPVSDELDSSVVDPALELLNEVKTDWRTLQQDDSDEKYLLRAVKEAPSAGPQDWFEAQLGPMGVAVDLAREMAREPAPFSSSNLFSSAMAPQKVASPSALFNLPPASSRAMEQRPSPLYDDSGRMIASQSSPSAIGIPTNQSQAAPSPDTFDEEMGMLECLPWTQEGMPEFIQNLGYVAGFSPTALQLNVPQEDQQPQQQASQPQQPQPQTRQQSLPSFLADNSTTSTVGEDQSYSRHGLNMVLEQWLGDVYGAGNGR